MEKFNVLNLVFGFIGNRLRRLIRQPDMDYITYKLAYGGKSKNVPRHYCVIDVTELEEGKYPDLNTVNKFIEDIFLHYPQLGNYVFIHCDKGRGRAPLVLVCYLIKYWHMSLDNAIGMVRRNRPYVYFTREQLRFLKDYKRNIK